MPSTINQSKILWLTLCTPTCPSLRIKKVGLVVPLITLVGSPMHADIDWAYKLHPNMCIYILSWHCWACSAIEPNVNLHPLRLHFRLLEFSILATFKVISGQVPTCGSTLGSQTTNTVTCLWFDSTGNRTPDLPHAMSTLYRFLHYAQCVYILHPVRDIYVIRMKRYTVTICVHYHKSVAILTWP